MKRLKKIFLGIVIGFATLYLAFYLLYSQTRIISSAINTFLNAQISGDAVVEFASMRGFFINQIILTDVKITLKRGEVIKLNYLDANLDLFSVIGGSYDFSAVYIDSIEVNLIRDPSLSAAYPSGPSLGYFDLYDVLNHENIHVSKLSIKNGKVILSDDKDAVQLDNLIYDGSFIVKKETVDIDIRRLSTELVSGKDRKRISLNTKIVGDETGIQINQTNVTYNKSNLIGKGLIKFNKNNDFVAFVDRGTLLGNDVGLENSESHGHPRFHFRMDANGNKSGVRTQLHVDSAHIEGYSVQKSDIEAFYNFDKGTINIFDATLNVNEAYLKLRGVLLGKETRLSLDFKNLDLKKLNIADVNSNLNGRINYAQSKLDFSGLSLGQNRVELTRSNVAGYQFNAATIIVENISDSIFFRPKSKLRFGKDASLNLWGAIDLKRKRMQLNFNGEKVELSPILKSAKVTPLSGVISPNFSIYGSLSDLNLSFQSVVDSLLIFDGFHIHKGEIKFEAEHLSKNIVGIGSITSDSTVFNQADSLQLSSNFTYRNDTLDITHAVISGDSSRLSTSGILAFSDSTTEYLFDKIQLKYDQYVIVNENPLHVVQSDTIYKIDQTVLVTPSFGRVSFGGIYFNDGSSTIEIDFSNIQFEPFNELIAFKHNIIGFINGKVRFYDLKNFLYDVNVHLNELYFTAKQDSAIYNRLGTRSVRFGEGDISYKFIDNTVEIDHLTFKDKESAFFLKGSINLDETIQSGQRFKLTSNFNNIKLEKYNLFIEYYKTLSGDISGSFSLAGNRLDPIGAFEISSKNLRVSSLNIDGVVKSKVENGQWVLNPSEIKINESVFQLSGTKDLKLNESSIGAVLFDGPFEFDVKTETDTITAVSTLNEEVSMITGKINLALKFKGTFDKPRLESGSIDLKKASLFLQKLGNPIRDINFKTTFTDGLIVLENFSGKTTVKSSELLGLVQGTQEGYVYINGNVNVQNLLHPVMNLSVNLDNFYADYFIENAQVFVDSDNLRITGRDTMLVKGDLRVSNSEVFFDYQNGLKNRYQSFTEISNKFLEFDFKIILEDNFRIYNTDPSAIRGFDFVLETPVSRPITYRTFADGRSQIRGLINIANGTFTSMQTFEIVQGEISLNDQDLTSNVSFNPRIQLEGRYESDVHLFKVSFNDHLLNLANVKIDVFDLSDENRNLNKTQLQVVSLLLFGQEDLSAFEGGQAFQTVAKSLANSNLEYVTDVEVSGIGNEPKTVDGEAVNKDVNVRVKTKVFRLAKGLGVKAVLNAGQSSTLVEKIEAQYRISESLILFLTSDEAILVNTSDSQREYELRLQWYYEF